MNWRKKILYRAMKDGIAPLLLKASFGFRKKRQRTPNPHFGPPLRCNRRLRELMTRHYFLARYAAGARPVAWVTSGAPVELLRVFGFYTVYPENHGALCGAQKVGSDLCAAAEAHGYSQDLCAYARIDLGQVLSGRTPVGKLPRPDLLFAANNICQTVVYWYKALARHWDIPLLVFDTPFTYTQPSGADSAYMVAQLEEMVPVLERISGRPFSRDKFQEILRLARRTATTWGEILATLKSRPAPMSIFDAFVHLAPIVSLRGLQVSLDYYRILLAELHERAAKGIGAVVEERKRLMWDNIAIWYKIRDFADLFAQRGMNFVTATYTNAWAETTPYMDENRPFVSLAETYSRIILNNNLRHRLALMSRLVADYQVDGLVIHSARSCKPYSLGQYDIRRLLMARLGIPAVVIEADIADARAFSEAQSRTRLEAFFETLENAPMQQGAER
jgi:bcr-type benzoyl-CoA reductase subunit B